ncbi:MAG: UMP kinase [Candidatus Comchoanobacterales bacterium]
MNKRILLKMSGEYLRGDTPFGVDPSVLSVLAQDVLAAKQSGLELGVVIGGGNFIRGQSLSDYGMDRITSDYMGMMGTVINSLALRDVFERAGISCVIQSALPVAGMVEPFDRQRSISLLAQGVVVIFSGGTGNPLVTTDSAASLRAIEIEADMLLKATSVDGVFDCDPKQDEQAKLFDHLTYDEALKHEYAVMDLSAFCQCRDHSLPIRVFNMTVPGQLRKVLLGDQLGTLVSHQKE